MLFLHSFIAHSYRDALVSYLYIYYHRFICMLVSVGYAIIITTKVFSTGNCQAAATVTI